MKERPIQPLAAEHPHPGRKRWPVTASDRGEALRVAKTRPWWPLCINKDAPFAEHKRWWFITNEDPRPYVKKTQRAAYDRGLVP